MTTTTIDLDSTEHVSARVGPRGSLENLSQQEAARLQDRGHGGLYSLFRRCALAVLNAGSDSDNPAELFKKYENFDVRIIRQAWGIRLELQNAPAMAFVDQQMIQGIKELLFAVLRDIVYTADDIIESGRFDLSRSADITGAVFHIIRNARLLDPRERPDLAVCWGGHSIAREEYEFTKLVGYELGLRGLNVCTGCGPGAMKGPMKGATIGHLKQRIYGGRYIGLTEPGIVAAEPPNPLVNQLVILPDIEKRLEAFVRLGHGIMIFPGGAGTAEELLYLLGILTDPANAAEVMPVILAGGQASASWFESVHHFIGLALGSAAQARYQVILGDPAQAARRMLVGMDQVRQQRTKGSDAYNFNWGLKIPLDFQKPFAPTHESVAALELNFDQPVHERAANLRRIFSAVVAGNIKEDGMRQITEKGPFEIRGDRRLLAALDTLLVSFVAQRRMKLAGDYRPVYRIVS